MCSVKFSHVPEQWLWNTCNSPKTCKSKSDAHLLISNIYRLCIYLMVEGGTEFHDNLATQRTIKQGKGNVHHSYLREMMLCTWHLELCYPNKCYPGYNYYKEPKTQHHATSKPLQQPLLSPRIPYRPTKNMSHSPLMPIFMWLYFRADPDKTTKFQPCDKRGIPTCRHTAIARTQPKTLPHI